MNLHIKRLFDGAAILLVVMVAAYILFGFAFPLIVYLFKEFAVAIKQLVTTAFFCGAIYFIGWAWSKR